MYNYDEDIQAGLIIAATDPELNSEYFISRIIRTINHLQPTDGTTYTCRSIEAYDSPINAGEYRIAARVPNKDTRNYHFIYQLSDDTWAGKNGTSPSERLGSGNPSVTPEMWANDMYDPSAGTIYFAVKRERV